MIKPVASLFVLGALVFGIYLLSDQSLVNPESEIMVNLVDVRRDQSESTKQHSTQPDHIANIGFLTIQSDDVGLQSEIPKNWSVIRETRGENDSKILVINSPDYHVIETKHDCRGEGCDPVTTTVVSGAQFSIISTIPTNFSKSLFDAEEYANFKLRIYQDCSNCFSVKKQTIDDVPAVIYGVQLDDEGTNKMFKATLMRNNRNISITFDYATSAPGITSVFDHFIDRLTFIPEKNPDSTGLLACVLKGHDLLEKLKLEWQGVQIGAPHEHISTVNRHCYISYYVFAEPRYSYVRDMDSDTELISCAVEDSHTECKSRVDELMSE